MLKVRLPRERDIRPRVAGDLRRRMAELQIAPGFLKKARLPYNRPSMTSAATAAPAMVVTVRQAVISRLWSHE